MEVHQVKKESRHMYIQNESMPQVPTNMYAPPLTKTLQSLLTLLLAFWCTTSTNVVNVLVLTLKTSNRIHLEPP